MTGLRGLLAASIAFCVTAAALCQVGTPTSMATSARGKLVKVEGNNLIVAVSQGSGERVNVSVATGKDTGFVVDFESGKLTDLKPGMEIAIEVKAASSSQPARQVVNAFAKGNTVSIVRIDGKKLIVQAGPQEATVETNEKTKILLMGKGLEPAKTGQFTDMKPGMIVKVYPQVGGTAVKIVAGNS